MKAKNIFAALLSFWIALSAVYAPVIHADKADKHTTSASDSETTECDLLPADFIAHSSAHIDLSPAFEFLSITIPQFSFYVLLECITSDTFSKLLIDKLLSSNIQINAP
jgi:hypothetical protein